MSKREKILLALLFSLLIFPFIFNYNKANNFVLNSQTINLLSSIHVSDSSLQGAKIGLVQTHGESNLWGSYSTHLNDAIGMGATITTITTTIDSTILKGYNIIVLGNGGSSWSASELDALSSWVSKGGGLYVLDDGYDSAQISVSGEFNIYYDTNPLIHVTPSMNLFHPIFDDVSSFQYPWPPCDVSIDLNAGRQDYTNIIRYDTQGIFIVLEINKGRIAWNVVSGNLISNSEISKDDHRTIGKNTWKWLAPSIPPLLNSDVLLLFALITVNPVKSNDYVTFFIILGVAITLGVIIAVVVFFYKISN